ncbi:MAG TPA: DUF167 domain-containing protein [Candidatus Dormibacteraeota bacterium]|jgi:hypothetical protein|nr:DUF167 domain-containing protein [Candidatus Dormibacteraeota bacterium]
MKVQLRVHTGASKERLQWDGQVLQVWVRARPVDGAANAAVIEAVADALGLPLSKVTLRSGLRSRSKLVEVEGFELDSLERFV